MENNFALSVKQVNLYVKTLLDSDRALSSVMVQGEISNFTRHLKSGHLYFTLKDDQAAIKAVMFKTSAVRLSFLPANGQTVIIHGRISLYERDGQYQLYADTMVPAGLGQAYLSFLALKDRLAQQGLFSPEHKKNLPAYPSVIGVATSPTGAAVQDVCSILARRWPLAKILLFPCLVQGEEAVDSLIQAVRYFNSDRRADVLLLVRGGGSYEDLAAFNDENLAFAVYDSEIPIVSGVGHETDYTILDFVADSRGATPSAAAELASPEISEVMLQLTAVLSKIAFCLSSVLQAEQLRLQDLDRRIRLREIIKRQQIQLASLQKDILVSFENHLQKQRAKLSELLVRIEAYNPLNVLGRGFGLIRNGSVSVKSVEQVQPGDLIDILLKDGEIYCAAKEIKRK